MIFKNINIRRKYEFIHTSRHKNVTENTQLLSKNVTINILNFPGL